MIASKAAKEIVKVFKGRFAHDPDSGIWHVFDGACWQAEPTPITLRREVGRWIDVAAEPVGFTPRYVDSALLTIQQLGTLPLPEQQDLIPFNNGMLDITTRELIRTTAENALTWALPYDYTPGATCPAIQSWLREMVGDAGTIQLLRAFMAALLRGPAKYQKFLHLVGPGSTGKGTFIRLLISLVGEKNTVTTDLRQLEQNRFEAATLYGKRLAMIADSDKYGGSINTLKSATGQDPLRLEKKHVQQAGSFIFEGLILMASNEALTTTDYTSGLERRRVTVPFERRTEDLPEHQMKEWEDRGGEAQLHAEIPGLVNWLLDMPVAEMAHVINNPPARVENANIEAMRDSNPVADWVMENCIPASGEWTQIGVKSEFTEMGKKYYMNAEHHLYPNYLEWCQQNGREPLSVRRFRPKVVDVLKNCLGIDVIEVKRKSGMGIQGVRIRGRDEEVFPWR